MYKDKQITYGSPSSSALARANSASESAPRAWSDASDASRSARQVGAADDTDSSPIEESSSSLVAGQSSERKLPSSSSRTDCV